MNSWTGLMLGMGQFTVRQTRENSYHEPSILTRSADRIRANIAFFASPPSMSRMGTYVRRLHLCNCPATCSYRSSCSTTSLPLLLDSQSERACNGSRSLSGVLMRPEVPPLQICPACIRADFLLSSRWRKPTTRRHGCRCPSG